MNVKHIKIFSVLTAISLCTTVLAQTDTIAKPIIINGKTEEVPAFKDQTKWIRTDLWVETEFDTDGDGKKDRVHVDVTRPLQTETQGLKLPVIYESSPYYAGIAPDAPGLFWNVQHELNQPASVPRTHVPVTRTGKRPIISNSLLNWVRRGFIIVHSSSPGTGLSQGSPTVGGTNEALAPKAVIEWLSGKDNGYTSPDGNEKVKAYWSTGRVGMTGTSYNGTLPVAAATTGVEGLKVIIPVAPVTSFYKYYRTNGLVRSPGGYLGEDVDVLYDYIHSGGDDAIRAYSNRVYRDSIIAKGLDRINGDYNDFWEERNFINKIGNMKAALLMAHGFNDWNVMPENSFYFYKAAQKQGLPAKIYYHQGGHGGNPPMDMMNRWFTRYLFDVQNDVEKDDNAWIVREDGKLVSYGEFPNPASASVPLFINNKSEITTKRQPKAKIEKFTDDVQFSGKDLATTDDKSHRLLFLSPTLKDSVHISGVASVSIKLAVNKTAANLSVWMVELGKDSSNKTTYKIITRGWADPQNTVSLRKSQKLVPGKFYTVNFDLQPDDQIIPKGKKIGFMIFSSDKEYTIWPKAGTGLLVDVKSTHLSLPIVGGKAHYLHATN